MKKLPLLLSLVITAIVLGTIGTVVKASNTVKVNQQVADLEQTLLEQQQAYEQMVTEANSRIEQANALLSGTQKSSTSDALLPPEEKLKLEDAISLALIATDNSPDQVSGHAELVEYDGKQSFEVKLADGSVVYIDAENGEILYNSLTGDSSSVIGEDQALIAAVKYMQGGKVVSVEKTKLDTTPVFLVTFESGDKVYINLGGEVLSLIKYQPVYTGYSSSGSFNSSSDIKKNKSSNSYDDHDDDDHKSDDDHDDD